MQGRLRVALTALMIRPEFCGALRCQGGLRPADAYADRGTLKIDDGHVCCMPYDISATPSYGLCSISSSESYTGLVYVASRLDVAS